LRILAITFHATPHNLPCNPSPLNSPIGSSPEVMGGCTRSYGE
jgi:hypothetical protein